MSKPPQLSGWIIGVSIGPGCTRVHADVAARPSSSAATLARPRTRELARHVARDPARAHEPVHRRDEHDRAAARSSHDRRCRTCGCPRNTPIWLTSMTLPVLVDGVVSTIGRGIGEMPALLTSTCSPPKPLDRGRDRGRPVGLARDVEVAVDAASSPSSRRDRVPLVVEHVAEHDPRASCAEEPGLGRTLAAGRAGDERDLPVETASRRLSVDRVGDVVELVERRQLSWSIFLTRRARTPRKLRSIDDAVVRPVAARVRVVGRPHEVVECSGGAAARCRRCRS